MSGDPTMDPPPDGYTYTNDDKTRRSHDVRIFDDGEVKLLTDEDGESKADNQTDEEKEADDKRAYVDLRRTDWIRIQRGRGMAFMKTYYHLLWKNKGCDHPASRTLEYLTIPDPDGESGKSVKIPLIKEILFTSATNSPVHLTLRRQRQTQFVRKKTIFNNQEHKGREIKIKGGSATHPEGKIEIVKSWRGIAGREAYYQGSKFTVPIWADPDYDKDKYGKGKYKE